MGAGNRPLIPKVGHNI